MALLCACTERMCAECRALFGVPDERAESRGVRIEDGQAHSDRVVYSVRVERPKKLTVEELRSDPYLPQGTTDATLQAYADRWNARAP
jgi:hypothetical protein